MTTAVFIDGAFFIKRLRHYMPKQDHYNAPKIANIAMSVALQHLKLRQGVQKNKQEGKKLVAEDDLYRVFFYDCPPLEKKMHKPISKNAIDLSKSTEAVFRKQLHQELIKRRKFALRLGRLSDFHGDWKLKANVLKQLLKNKKYWHELTDDDFTLNIMQKGVDMRIGVDISTVCLKNQANRMVLIAGDADFVPAAKLARREGVDFILDAMHQPIPQDLFEHIDGLWTTYFPPSSK